MVEFVLQHPRVAALAAKLRQIPRWGWIAIGLGVVLPVVVVLGALAAVALASGALVALVVLAIMALLRLFRRVRGPADDGRRNVRIVVRSVQVRSPHQAR